MDPFILAGFQDELEKIAGDGLQNQKPESETLASKANAFFGLPLGHPRKRNTRDYEQAAAAQTADRSQPGAGAQSGANISSGNAMNPASGPGGV